MQLEATEMARLLEEIQELSDLKSLQEPALRNSGFW